MSVTLINPFEVPKGKEEECLEMWKEAAEYLKNQPGFINTKLHQSIIDDAKFKYINVAEWETPESFFKAVDTDEFKKILDFVLIKNLSVLFAILQIGLMRQPIFIFNTVSEKTKNPILYKKHPSVAD